MLTFIIICRFWHFTENIFSADFIMLCNLSDSLLTFDLLFSLLLIANFTGDIWHIYYFYYWLLILVFDRKKFYQLIFLCSAICSMHCWRFTYCLLLLIIRFLKFIHCLRWTSFISDCSSRHLIENNYISWFSYCPLSVQCIVVVCLIVYIVGVWYFVDTWLSNPFLILTYHRMHKLVNHFIIEANDSTSY